MESETPVHIIGLTVENVKRVQAVTLEPTANGLTVIGGRNGQGKTSVLDAIMWALGGDRFKPSSPLRDGADKLKVALTLDNGITVERKGAAGALHVSSQNGNKAGQSLLNEFVNAFALNLPKFMQATGTEKAKLLLDTFPGIGAELQRLNEEAKRLYDERHTLGVIADRKAKYAAEMPYCAEAPDELLSGTEMAMRLQSALSLNARNQALRQNATKTEDEAKGQAYRLQSARKRVADLEHALKEALADMQDQEKRLNELNAAYKNATQATLSLLDQDLTSIRQEMEDIDAINARVRTNQNKRNAEDEARQLKAQYNDLTAALETVRGERMKLLGGVVMPLAGLEIDEEGALTLNGRQWDCMSTSEQMRVAAAICSAMKPQCGFVLMDQLEKMDTETLAEFGAWLQTRNLQVIGTRVGVGEENTIVIEDGLVAGEAEFKF